MVDGRSNGGDRDLRDLVDDCLGERETTMAESNSDDLDPPLCPCGFWGSTKTSGLCSKCYKEKLAREGNMTSICVNNAMSALTTAPPPPPLTSAVFTGSQVTTESLPLLSLTNLESSKTSASDAATNAQLQDAQISSTEVASAEAAAAAAAAAVKIDFERPIQRNKKRCFKCKTRLELAFVEIGRCKCDCIFCEIHRLPEQHECSYDHKEQGRKEAREKMISPKKHVGTMLKRLDSDA